VGQALAGDELVEVDVYFGQFAVFLHVQVHPYCAFEQILLLLKLIPPLLLLHLRYQILDVQQ